MLQCHRHKVAQWIFILVRQFPSTYYLRVFWISLDFAFAHTFYKWLVQIPQKKRKKKNKPCWDSFWNHFEFINLFKWKLSPHVNLRIHEHSVFLYLDLFYYFSTKFHNNLHNSPAHFSCHLFYNDYFGWRINAFELRYWIRPLRVPWTARSSSQSILKEINPELEGLKAEVAILWPPDEKS